MSCISTDGFTGVIKTGYYNFLFLKSGDGKLGDIGSSVIRSYYSSFSLAPNSLSSVELSNLVGSSFGLKFLVFQLLLTKPLALSKFVASFLCSFFLYISASIRDLTQAHSFKIYLCSSSLLFSASLLFWYSNQCCSCLYSTIESVG